MISTVITEKKMLQVFFEWIYVCKELIHIQDAQKYDEECMGSVEHVFLSSLVSNCILE